MNLSGYRWTGEFNANEVTILEMSLENSIKEFQKEIADITASKAMNLTPEVKTRLIIRYEQRISEHTALLERIGCVKGLCGDVSRST